MARRHQTWSVGDVFVVPRVDGRFVIGQIVGREAEMLNSISIALFDRVVAAPEDVRSSLPAQTAEVFATLFVTRELLDRWRWKVETRWPVRLPESMLPYEHLRARRWVGAKMIGSGNVEKFVNAFYGLAPWDDWKDPNYLDGLLLSPDKKPVDRLVYKASQP